MDAQLFLNILVTIPAILLLAIIVLKIVEFIKTYRNPNSEKDQAPHDIDNIEDMNKLEETVIKDYKNQIKVLSTQLESQQLLINEKDELIKSLQNHLDLLQQIEKNRSSSEKELVESGVNSEASNR